MRKMKFSILLTFLCLSALAQTSVITGKVVDGKTKEPLAFANVFFNNTTRGTTTDLEGQFTLGEVGRSGIQEIVVSFVGYKLFRRSVTLSDNDIDLGRIELAPSTTSLDGIVVKERRDKEWERNLEKFKKIFLGTTSIAENCTILNPWVINFTENDKTTLVNADEPIQIRNEYLGYQIYFFLNQSSIENISYSIHGAALFQELRSPNYSRTLEWVENRQDTYLKSSRHFFKSIIDGDTQYKGFLMYEDARPDGWHKEATNNFRIMLSTEKVRQKDVSNLIFPDTLEGVKRILIDKRVEVHYSKARTRVPAYDDVIYPVSWLLVKGGYLRVNEDGIPLNISDLITSGDMNEDWITRMLPVDYHLNMKEDSPVQTATGLDQFREYIYVHVDKPYYYPGERIWFKAYLKYHEFSLRNSLSKILYVDLIDPMERVIETKNLPISQGTAAGDFKLVDSLKTGSYYLRAYTTLMRNFGDSSLYVRPIPVLKITDKVESNATNGQDSIANGVLITAHQSEYAPRERVKLKIVTIDGGEPISSNVSISVTDQIQVATINGPSIMNAFSQMESLGEKLNELRFPIETGITVTGKVEDKKKSAASTLTMVNVDSKDMFLIDTDKQGLFWISGLGFYDSANFLLQAKNKKGKPFGTVSIANTPKPMFYFSGVYPQLKLLETESPQRIESAYVSQEGVRILDGVEIESTRIRAEYQQDYRVKRPYGKPDYVLKGEDLEASYGSLLLDLPGKFPGLNVRQTANEGEELRWVVYLQRSVSLGKPKEVLVTLNDVVVGGSNPASILATIDPATVESIELKAGINVLYGEQGGFGVLSIYTKTKPSAFETELSPNFQLASIAGYSRPRNFRFPYYDNPTLDASIPDYRSTIYWNPNVITDPKSGTAEVSFFAADLPGRYKVVVEGVTYGGVPIRGELLLDIEDN